MDLHLKQWRSQHESDHVTSPAKIPKLFFDSLLDQQQQQQQHQTLTMSSSPALSLFDSEPNNNKSIHMSAFPDSNTRFQKMGSYFSSSQWQELELQALIYRYMLAGAVVPPELLQPIKKSLILSSSSSPYFLQQYPLYQPSLLQSGYWGRGAMDPEPGRCRRTDGKKWRCSRDVVVGQKYCERHVHRGRSRSRKPVETPTSEITATATATTTSSPLGVSGRTTTNTASRIGGAQLGVVGNGPSFSLSGSTPSNDLFRLNQSIANTRTTDTKGLFETQNGIINRSDGHVLRHFFDDWPCSLQESKNGRSTMHSSTSLSISMPGNSSSDISLKLSTGDGEELSNNRVNEREQQPQQLNWAAGWGANQMGGPLAEALRSSTSNSSPTSVLHQLNRGSASETSFVST